MTEEETSANKTESEDDQATNEVNKRGMSNSCRKNITAYKESMFKCQFESRQSLSVDNHASRFVYIPCLSCSGVKSLTECQQSLFESHFASRLSLSDCPVAF